MTVRSVLTFVLAASTIPACGKKPADTEGAKGSGSGSGGATVVVKAGSGSGSSTAPVGSGAGSAAMTGSGSGSAAATPTGDSGGFTATMEGKPYKFAAARIQGSGDVEDLIFTTGAKGCNNAYNAADIELHFPLEQGPGGKHFAGQALAGTMAMLSPTTPFKYMQLTGSVTTEPTEWKVGNKVKGTLKMAETDGSGDKKVTYEGSGPFEAEICSLSSTPLEAPPDTVDAKPASGNFGATKFAMKSGIAILDKDNAGNDIINKIWLFESAVTCDTYKDAKVTKLLISGRGGETKDTPTGTFQQAGFAHRDPKDAQSLVIGPNWVKYDTIELKVGGTVKGSFYVATGAARAKAEPKDASKIAGTFTATVCAR